MRKIYYLLGVLPIFYSCSELESCHNEISLVSDVITRTAGDGKYDVLGYGYDITDEYMGENSVRLKILDVDAFVKNDSGRYDNPFLGVIDQRVYAGENAYSFLDQLIKDSNFNGSVASVGKAAGDSGYFSATIKTGFKSDRKYFYSSKYSFARAEVLKKQRRYLLNTDVETLSRYLSSVFVEDLNKYSADKIVEMYGTHVLANIVVGGTYIAYYKSAIVETDTRNEKTKTVSAGAKFNLSKIGLDANGTWSTTEITETNNKNSNWECYIKSIGGSTSGTSITLNPNQGPTFTINLGDWTKSVDDQHSRLIDVDWNATYPIYDLISDPIKKQEIKEAVQRYINSKKIDVIDIIPVFRYYSNKHVDHMFATHWRGANDNGDVYEEVACYICATQESGTIPLYQYYNSKHVNHMYPAHYRGENDNGDRCEGVIGYVYPTQVEGTVPLYRYYNSKHVNHMYCTHWRGANDNGDVYEGIECYVYPNN